MQLVKEHINFKRGLDPKDAMGIGIWKNIKPMMNGVLATMEENADMAYLKYIETVEWRDQVDEETGEVGWPYIHIVADVNTFGISHLHRKKLRHFVKIDLEYIFKKLGIAGKVEVTPYNDREYHFYPENN